jgi:hypothetical protein
LPPTDIHSVSDWRPAISMKLNRPERIQQKFESVCFYSVSPQMSYGYTYAFENLSLHPLRKRRNNLDALFFVQANHGLKSCPVLLEHISLRVPTRYVREFSMFSICLSVKHSPSVRCAQAVNVVAPNRIVLYCILSYS